MIPGKNLIENKYGDGVIEADLSDASSQNFTRYFSDEDIRIGMQ